MSVILFLTCVTPPWISSWLDRLSSSRLTASWFQLLPLSLCLPASLHSCLPASPSPLPSCFPLYLASVCLLRASLSSLPSLLFASFSYRLPPSLTSCLPYFLPPLLPASLPHCLPIFMLPASLTSCLITSLSSYLHASCLSGRHMFKFLQKHINFGGF